jgi:Family of unknown function (DUF6069)
MTEASRLPSRLQLGWGNRVVAVVVAMIATALVFLIVTLGFAQALYTPGFGGSPPQELSIWLVAATAGVAGVAAVGVLAVIERITRRPARAWSVVSTTALIVSLGAPLFGEGIETANKLTLASMHLTAGAVLIPLLYRNARLREERVAV